MEAILHLWQNNWEILQLPFAQQYCYNTHAEEHILVNEELLANPLVPTFWYALTTSLYGSPRLASLCSSTRVFGSQVHGIWLCNISAIYSQKNITSTSGKPLHRWEGEAGAGWPLLCSFSNSALQCTLQCWAGVCCFEVKCTVVQVKCFESWCTVAKCRVGGSELGAHTPDYVGSSMYSVCMEVHTATCIHSAGVLCLGAGAV